LGFGWVHNPRKRNSLKIVGNRQLFGTTLGVSQDKVHCGALPALDGETLNRTWFKLL